MLRQYLLVIFGLSAVAAHAQTVEELQQRLDELESQIEVFSANQAAQVFNDYGDEAPNLLTHLSNNAIDPYVFAATINGGGYGGNPKNYIGYSVDGYAEGYARFAVIGGGYDNRNNHYAGTVSGGAHHQLYGGAYYGTVGGGSVNYIHSGAYASIGGGSTNYISNGANSTIAGGRKSIVSQKYATISGGGENTVDAKAGVIAGGVGNTVTGAAINGVVIGGILSESAARYSVAFGKGVIGDVPASLSFAGRYNQNPGDAQALQFHLSGITRNDSSKPLSVASSSALPEVPEGAAWTGEAYVLARSASGDVASWVIPVTVGMNGGQGWSITSGSVDGTTIVDDLGLGVDALSLSVVSTTGAFMLNARGLPTTELHWGAYVVLTQVK